MRPSDNGGTNKLLEQLAAAMNAARARTGAPLAQEVKAGRFRIVRVTFDSRGKSTVVPLTTWAGAQDHLNRLDEMGRVS